MVGRARRGGDGDGDGDGMAYWWGGMGGGVGVGVGWVRCFFILRVGGEAENIGGACLVDDLKGVDG